MMRYLLIALVVLGIGLVSFCSSSDTKADGTTTTTMGDATGM